MARHRNVRTMKYEEEFFDEDDVEDCYGQSFDDKYCISPGTAAQFTFSRGSNFDLGSYISGEPSPTVPSQVPEIITPKSQPPKVTKNFNDFNEARLNSCYDQISEIIPNVHPREMVIDCIKKHNYNTEAVLNDLLSSPDAPKPQRQPRQGRRAQGLYAQSDTPMSEYVVDDDDEERVISEYTLVGTMPHYKLRRKYNSVGEEEGSSYSSVNSGDTEDQQGFLSEQNGDSLGHDQILLPLESGRMSGQNVASSIESSDDDDDLEVDSELQAVIDDDDDDCVSVRKMLTDEQIQMMPRSKYISTSSENNAPSTESSDDDDDDDDLEVDGELQAVIDDDDDDDCVSVRKMLTDEQIQMMPRSKYISTSSENNAPSTESSDDDDDDDLEVDGELQAVIDDDDDCVSVRKMLTDEQIQMMPRSKYISTSSENNAPSTESSDDDDLEVDGADCIGIKKIPNSFGRAQSSSMFCCKTAGSFELSNMTANNPQKMLANKSCNDKALKSPGTISASSRSSSQKCDKQDLLKLFEMANINKQKMEESVSLTSANKKGFSALSKPSLSEEISRNPLIQNQTNLESNYDKSLSSSKENSFKLDIFQQKDNNGSSSSSSSKSCGGGSSNNNDYDLSPSTNKCKECSANQVNSKKSSKKMSLADLTRQRFGSTVKEPFPKGGSFLSPLISSSCPNKKNNSPSAQPLTTDSSNSQPLIDLTNHCCPGQSSNSSDGKLFSFQSLDSENESSKTQNKDKISVASLADLMKQRSTSDFSLSPLQSHKDFSLTEIFKKDVGDTCLQGTSEKSIDKKSATCIKESEFSFSKTPFDIQKINSPLRELSTNINDTDELTISQSGSKKDCQPMSLGELFSRVNDGKIDVNSDATNKLEDLWQGPSRKPIIEQSQEQESPDLDKNLENTSEIKFLLPSFLGISSEYQDVKTIYEAPASMFGTVVSYHPQTVKYPETIPSPRRKNRYHKFSYKSQMSGMSLNRETKLAPIVPFDFSTPSPDDIVKKHQSQAFCHKNIEPGV